MDNKNVKINANLWRSYSNVKFVLQTKIEVTECAIITAWNPNSVKLSQYENCVNNQRLQSRLESYYWYPVRVGDPVFNWYEESFVIEMPLEDALKLGRAFNQNAIYYVSHHRLFLHSCIGFQQECLGDFSKYIA